MTRSSIFFPYWFPVHQQPWEVCIAVVLKLDPNWLKWPDTLLTTLRLITGTNKGGPLTLMFMPGLIIVIVLSPLCWLLPRLNLRPATSQWVVLLATLLTFFWIFCAAFVIWYSGGDCFLVAFLPACLQLSKCPSVQPALSFNLLDDWWVRLNPEPMKEII